MAKVELKPVGSQGEQAKGEEKSIATKAQTWKDLLVTRRIMNAHRKDKNGDIKRLGDRKVTRFGGNLSD